MFDHYKNFCCQQAGMSFATPDRTGMCLLIPGSLFNHSCFPNVKMKVAMPNSESVAILPIKKGEKVSALFKLINFKYCSSPTFLVYFD